MQHSPPNTHCSEYHEKLLGREALCSLCARNIRVERAQQLAAQAAKKGQSTSSEKEMHKQLQQDGPRPPGFLRDFEKRRAGVANRRSSTRPAMAQPEIQRAG